MLKTSILVKLLCCQSNLRNLLAYIVIGSPKFYSIYKFALGHFSSWVRHLSKLASKLQRPTTLATWDPSEILAFSQGEKPARKLTTGQITAPFGSLCGGRGRPDPRVFPRALPHVSRHRARFPVCLWVALSFDLRR